MKGQSQFHIFRVSTKATRCFCSMVQSQKISESFLKLIKDQELVKTSGFVAGQWIQNDSGQTYEVLDPSTNEHVANVALLDGAATSKAITAAEEAFTSWSQLTGKERSIYVRRWLQEMQKNSQDLASIMVAENGKPMSEALVEVEAACDSVEWSSEECKRVCGDTLETINKDRRMLTIKQPIGVVGAITPWNFPCAMITRKIAPAIAAGCTVVLKPSELTPLSAFALAELANRAGIPPGVINIVSGDAKSIGLALLKSPIVRKIGFTGSTAVGKYLMEQAASTVKRISLELGGNAPFIVFDDADLELAVKFVMGSGFRNAGQTCISVNRTFVHDKVYDKFEELVTAEVKKFQVGNGFDSQTTVGPVITKQALTKVQEHVEDAVQQGATVTIGGTKAPDLLEQKLQNGNFFAPTVLRDAKTTMRCFKEETFGPTLPLFRFSTEDKVLSQTYLMPKLDYTTNTSTDYLPTYYVWKFSSPPNLIFAYFSVFYSQISIKLSTQLRFVRGLDGRET
eukprot:TRINITY_DN5178_c0_g1_i2.p1 TRINITY_DN5178_c0_g1~~TRINITY_DN5178_c0_g1_i2.p1  ORF type:complete len:537 (-),score=69.24 TRINITY_DN5178_c0_g1_i2:506-2038(-)